MTEDGKIWGDGGVQIVPRGAWSSTKIAAKKPKERKPKITKRAPRAAKPPRVASPPPPLPTAEEVAAECWAAYERFLAELGES